MILCVHQRTTRFSLSWKKIGNRKENGYQARHYVACAAILLSCHYDFTRYSCNQNLKPISCEIAGATHIKKTSSKVHFAPLCYVVVAQRTSTKTSCTLVYQCSSSSIGRREQVWKLPHLPSRNSNGWKSFLHKKVFAALLTPVIYVRTY